mgnify:CR=1 FL=1
MSKAYSNLGLSSRLRSVNSISERTKVITGVEFESQFEVQASRLNVSKINLGEFIKRSTGGTVLGTFSTSQALDITSTITYNTPKASNRTFGKPIVAIYQGAGTASGSQIYPIRGTAVTLGRYDVVGGEIDYANYNGTADQWRAMIIDTNGTSSQVVTFATDWLFTDYVTDDVA